jgi:hypothetical protein
MKAEHKTFRLSPRLAVTFTVGAAGMVCEWDPRIPRELSAPEVEAYRTARDEMAQRQAELVGGRVLTVELPTGPARLHEPKEDTDG